MKIRYKLFLAILATAFVSVFALQQAQRYSFEKGLKRYSDNSRFERLAPLILGLSDIYARDGNWDALRGQRRLPIPELLVRSDWQGGLRNSRPRSRRFYSGLTLLDSNKKPIATLCPINNLKGQLDAIVNCSTWNDQYCDESKRRAKWYILRENEVLEIFDWATLDKLKSVSFNHISHHSTQHHSALRSGFFARKCVKKYSLLIALTTLRYCGNQG